MKAKFNKQFEVTLYHKENIICQRYFEDYNFKDNDIGFDVAVNIIKSTTEMIKNHLKLETMKHLYSKYNYVQNATDESCVNGENQVIVIISHKEKSFASSCIDISVYPAKIRHSIDIRPIIPSIISKIRKQLKKE